MGKIADTTRTWTLGQEQRRQLLAFDAELEDAKEKVRVLEAKRLDLEEQVKPLQREVERLQKQLEEQTAKTERAAKLAEYKATKSAEPTEDDHLDDPREKILKFLAMCKIKGRSWRNGPGADEIARVLDTNEIRARVILREMAKAQYIWCTDDGEWNIGDKAEEYLVKHGHA